MLVKHQNDGTMCGMVLVSIVHRRPVKECSRAALAVRESATLLALAGRDIRDPKYLEVVRTPACLDSSSVREILGQ